VQGGGVQKFFRGPGHFDPLGIALALSSLKNTNTGSMRARECSWNFFDSRDIPGIYVWKMCFIHSKISIKLIFIFLSNFVL